MNNELILAFDIGTSSVRAALYDADAEVIPQTFVKNERHLSETDDGGAEIDPGEAIAQVVKAIDDVIGKSAGIDGSITMSTASCFWHSLVGIDDTGEPTTSVYAWGEKRPARFVAELRGTLDESAVHNRTGAQFHSSFWPAKLLWLKDEQPENYKRTARWISFSDLVALKLFGTRTTSVSMASATGIFDQRRCDWDPELLDFLDLTRENLAPIADTDDATFRLTEDYARRWPRLAETRWLPAIGDGAANNLGAGCDSGDKAALMIGTSGAMRVVFEGEVPERIPCGLWCYRVDRRRLIIGGALSDGGGLFRWLKDNLKLSGTDDEVEAEIGRREPDAHGLTFLPFLFGERSTGYHENARGAILGLQSTTDSIDIVQAGLESVAYRFAEIFDRLNEVCKIKEIIASGGALRESPVWTQIIADVVGRDMFLPDTREASSRGAVVFALGLSNRPHDSKAPDGTRFEFDAMRRITYLRSRGRHRHFYDTLTSAS